MKTKSYSDIEKQVNRIFVNYLVDEYSQPINETAQQRIYKVRDIQHRYTFNINKSEGFCSCITWEYAKANCYGGIVYPYGSVTKKYPREIYAKQTEA